MAIYKGYQLVAGAGGSGTGTCKYDFGTLSGSVKEIVEGNNGELSGVISASVTKAIDEKAIQPQIDYARLSSIVDGVVSRRLENTVIAAGGSGSTLYDWGKLSAGQVVDGNAEEAFDGLKWGEMTSVGDNLYGRCRVSCDCLLAFSLYSNSSYYYSHMLSVNGVCISSTPCPEYYMVDFNHSLSSAQVIRLLSGDEVAAHTGLGSNAFYVGFFPLKGSGSSTAYVAGGAGYDLSEDGDLLVTAKAPGSLDFSDNDFVRSVSSDSLLYTKTQTADGTGMFSGLVLGSADLNACRVIGGGTFADSAIARGRFPECAKIMNGASTNGAFDGVSADALEFPKLSAVGDYTFTSLH